MEFWIFQPSTARQNHVIVGPFGDQGQAEAKAIALHKEDGNRETVVLQKLARVQSVVQVVRN